MDISFSQKETQRKQEYRKRQQSASYNLDENPHNNASLAGINTT